MVALITQLLRRDAILKVLENQFQRDKGLTLELIAGLCELLGMSCQIANTSTVHINSVEAPAIIFLENVPTLFYGTEQGNIIIAHPHHGIKRLEFKQIENQLGEEFRFVLPRRIVYTNKSLRLELVYSTKKIQKITALVFVASLLAKCLALRYHSFATNNRQSS